MSSLPKIDYTRSGTRPPPRRTTTDPTQHPERHHHRQTSRSHAPIQLRLPEIQLPMPDMQVMLPPTLHLGEPFDIAMLHPRVLHTQHAPTPQRVQPASKTSKSSHKSQSHSPVRRPDSLRQPRPSSTATSPVRRPISALSKYHPDDLRNTENICAVHKTQLLDGIDCRIRACQIARNKAQAIAREIGSAEGPVGVVATRAANHAHNVRRHERSASVEPRRHAASRGETTRVSRAETKTVNWASKKRVADGDGRIAVEKVVDNQGKTAELRKIQQSKPGNGTN
ncbi:hypothetical protein K491DRAFT_782299 [Lophiostoma macrostomum CBS 122681]|uniref:Uncharacterized protein n=1 Tax=Lophiostoma macrostomum CBS 122681 TaxID=1314788 RepID=A0A6A6SV96_9PLEO|nr:hypothetical protein K491DRAFT_782299 [Lophiostoma macrostomum CBS 122681]